MGKKENYLHYILDQLSDVPDITFKKQFGAICFYRQGRLFGVIVGGVFRLRMPACAGDVCGHLHSAPYFQSIIQDDAMFCEVPPEVIDDSATLRSWADAAFEVALREATS